MAREHRLLHRQARLLEYLTSREAIFGERGSAPFVRGLDGIDPRLLELEARFSYEKRRDKIIAVFPRTLRILGIDQAPILTAFVAACPPVDIRRIVNARQFHEFLSKRWRHDPPQPPYLRDVADCELKIAAVRADMDEIVIEQRRVANGTSVRRRRGVGLMRCAYDIRPAFEQDNPETATIARRDTPLAIAVSPDTLAPQIFEILPAVFDLLSALDRWTRVASIAPAPELKELVAELVEYGLIEARR